MDVERKGKIFLSNFSANAQNVVLDFKVNLTSFEKLDVRQRSVETTYLVYYVDTLTIRDNGDMYMISCFVVNPIKSSCDS